MKIPFQIQCFQRKNKFLEYLSEISRTKIIIQAKIKTMNQKLTCKRKYDFEDMQEKHISGDNFEMLVYKRQKQYQGFEENDCKNEESLFIKGPIFKP